MQYHENNRIQVIHTPELRILELPDFTASEIEKQSI